MTILCYLFKTHRYLDGTLGEGAEFASNIMKREWEKGRARERTKAEERARRRSEKREKERSERKK